MTLWETLFYYSCFILHLSHKIFQRLSSTCQNSINISVSENLAFLLAILITFKLIWCTEIYYLPSLLKFLFSYHCFLPCRIWFINFFFGFFKKFEHFDFLKSLSFLLLLYTTCRFQEIVFNQMDNVKLALHWTIYMIQFVWLTINFQIFIAFTHSCRLFIPSL